MLALVGLGYLWTPQIVTCYFARQWARESPGLNAVPRPLTDLRIDSGKGTTVELYGYTIEAPWADIEFTKDVRIASSVGFKSGANILLFDPNGDPSILSIIQGMDEKQNAKIRDVLGSDTVRSEYDFSKAVYFITANDISLWMSRQRAARAIILMNIKSSQVSSRNPDTFLLETALFRGFQEGSPDVEGVRGRQVRIRLFDSDGKELQLVISAKKGASLTQAQINRVIQSIRPAVSSR
ncbi:MAG TPA: hypothetical protein VN577_22160 [Terriglobales bacterium]|nr:hypothetical protein [Terriglobales bacterium]